MLALTSTLTWDRHRRRFTPAGSGGRRVSRRLSRTEQGVVWEGHVEGRSSHDAPLASELRRAGCTSGVSEAVEALLPPGAGEAMKPRRHRNRGPADSNRLDEDAAKSRGLVPLIRAG